MFVLSSIFTLSSSKAARVQPVRTEKHGNPAGISSSILLFGSFVGVLILNRAARFVKYP
jgi:hypothetical protein